MAHPAFLERIRRALDYDESSHRGGLRLSGRGELFGLPSRWEHHTHADGRLVERVGSRMPSSRGFDGARGWALDATGLVAPCELGDLEFLRLYDAVLTGAWLHPNGAIDVDAVSTSGTHARLALRWRGGRGRYHLSVDTRSDEPHALTPAAGVPFTVRFARYGLRGWARVPTVITLETGHLVDRITVDAVTADDAIDAAAPARHDGTTFSATTDTPVRVRRSRRGRLPLVDAAVDGRTVGPWLLDTGAGAMALDTVVADALELSTRGRTWVTTSDGGTGACFRVAQRFQLGPLCVSAPVFLDLDLTHLREALGVKLAGIVGYDVFARCCATLRDGGASLVLHPADDTLPPGYAWEPLRFEERTPLVRCATARGDGLFALDSGSAAPITCYADIITAWALRSTTRRASWMYGASGRRAVRTSALPWLSVGAARFDRVRATLDAERDTLASTPGRDGTIGWPLLARLDPILDCKHARIALPQGPRAQP